MPLSKIPLIELLEMLKNTPMNNPTHHFLLAEHKKRMFAISYDDGDPLFAEDVRY